MFEDYWNIGFRTFGENASVIDGGGKYRFDLLKAGKRYWYADPFLFEKNGTVYLFMEMFDNRTERGVIGCSEYRDGGFTEPRVVLSESFHLSYPYVFEKDGAVYMMPETHEENYIGTYRAASFPDKWEKAEVLVGGVNAVDTITENNLLIASVLCPENDMSVDLCVYDLRTGAPCDFSPVYKSSATKRGAGKCFWHKGKRIRPSQSCENGNYGGKLCFNEITECSAHEYGEKPYSQITPDNIDAGDAAGSGPYGVHTYARTDTLELVDVKLKRCNTIRLFWIVKNKLIRSV